MVSEKSVIIFGTGGSCIHCDFVADEVWGCNGAFTVINVMPEKLKKYFRMDKLFLTDFMYEVEGRLNFDIVAMNEFASEYNCEVISMRKMKLGKYELKCKLLPYNRLVNNWGTNYFTDSITYMIAYALNTNTVLAQSPTGVIRRELKQPLRIRLFGVDMVTTKEYQASKGGIEFWLGIARGLGAEIEVAQGSAIMANPQGRPYGRPYTYILKDVDPYGLLKKRE